MDSGNKVASKSSKYGKRRQKSPKHWVTILMARRSTIRLYDQRRQRMGDGERLCSCLHGLMDMMNDNEIEGVLGHELATSRWVTRWLK